MNLVELLLPLLLTLDVAALRRAADIGLRAHLYPAARRDLLLRHPDAGEGCSASRTLGSSEPTAVIMARPRWLVPSPRRPRWWR